MCTATAAIVAASTISAGAVIQQATQPKPKAPKPTPVPDLTAEQRRSQFRELRKRVTSGAGPGRAGTIFSGGGQSQQQVAQTSPLKVKLGQ
jgi:hypothetical protein